ncbi:hypothetical protein [Dokdonella ginsengisoli]|uniref:Uncharacterized protein n=1 Tax=Dokdonella ginsengisoli TaxID=363846 RepID=A0ABV9R0P3_9GAMM
MQPETPKRLKELRQLHEVETYLQGARTDLRLKPGNQELRAFVGMAEKVLAYERKRLAIKGT